MMKFVVVGVLLALAHGGSALMQHGDIASASKGDWDRMHQLLLKKYIDSRIPAASSVQPSQPASNAALLTKLPIAPGGATPGGHYYAQSEYSYERKSNTNGKVEEDSGGLGMINDNGQVTYYKPNPAANTAPLGYNNQNPANSNAYHVTPYGG